MVKLTCTQEEIAVLKHEKDYHPVPKVRQRCEIVYLKTQGFMHKEIEKIVGISHGTVTTALKLYQQGGFEAVQTLNYKGQPSDLHAHTETIKASLVQQPVATYKEAKARIKDLTKLDRSIPQITHFLDQIGCTRRKVRQIPDKLDIEKQETFKHDTLEPLLDRAQRQEIHVGFLDAAHFVLRPFLGVLLCFAPLFVKASAGRKRYNVLGALDAVTNELTLFTNFTYINSLSICALLDKLKAHYTDGRPIQIILDHARYQKNKFVQAHVDQLDITFVYLPAYSPNLNLIERLWKFVKKKVLYSTYYADFPAFTEAIDQCLADT
jgi:transposase